MASQAALEAADEARRYDRESAPSPEPQRFAPLTAPFADRHSGGGYAFVGKVRQRVYPRDLDLT